MLCISLIEHAANITNFDKKEILPLSKKQLKYHQIVTDFYICRKKVTHKVAKDENYRKVRDHYHFIDKYRCAAYSICNFVSLEIPVVFKNRSNCDYHFIIKELANELKDQFECNEENTGKQKTFSIPMEIAEKLIKMVMMILRQFLVK